ncbi:uncharacterized protein LOC105248142 [Camponotus floridanus]|uniref:uncharacterized protein LOC105248142 n=1 Tax=Camponotus floridanus TaxID=104421 RepID=UPI000DC6D0B4|nr:uncharacterized protein LOC105248142 [Camponotus floridanus]
MYSSTITEYEDNKSRKLTLETKNGKNSILDQLSKENIPVVQSLVWTSITLFSVLHIIVIYLFVTRYNEAKFWTWIFAISYEILGGLGITAGAHRFWAHRSYSATLPLKIMLACLFCSVGQFCLTKWIHIHRMHHRYTDTSADPHNASRGFFFSHIGWLMVKCHPAVKEGSKNVDMSDIAADPVVRFFDKYYLPIMFSLCFVLPTLVPVYIWNETWIISIGATIFRYIYLFNAAAAVNSFAHIWGTRPYNRNLKATENPIVAFFAHGEGWHNYHHCFPWDYKAAELGLYRLNLPTAFIDFMAWLGLAYDLKTPSSEMIDKFCAKKAMYDSITDYEENKSRKLTLGTKNGKNSILDQPPKENIPAVQPLIWHNVIGIPLLHVIAIYLFVTRYNEAKFGTWIFTMLYAILGGLGVTAGAHRFWAHRSYSATLLLKIMLTCFYCTTGEFRLTEWIHVHRAHHRYTGTCADPHNASRGFFFSHVGWLMMKHHPAVKEYGKNVDMSDIAADPVIRFFDKYFSPIMLSLCFVLPSLIPVYIWNETWIVSIGATLIRHLLILNATFAVNSFAHSWGTHPYDRNLNATENPILSFLVLGEGWHNYHHCFPWDYKAAELGLYRLNLTTAFIDFMAWLGLAYDLKTSSSEIIDKLCAKNGDGTNLLKLNAK